jgi:hypothetical protein
MVWIVIPLYLPVASGWIHGSRVELILLLLHHGVQSFGYVMLRRLMLLPVLQCLYRPVLIIPRHE